MPITDRKLRVFLCHSSQDKPIVRELYQRLSAESWVEPWLDEEKLIPGMDWDAEVTKSLLETDAVIVSLSTTSITKEGYVRKEINTALEKLKEKPEDSNYFIPVRLEECNVPARLQHWQYVDYFPDPKKDQSYQLLLAGLRLRANILGINKAEKIESVSVEKAVIEFGQEIALTLQLPTNQLLEFFRSKANKFLNTDNIYIALIDKHYRGNEVVRFDLVYQNSVPTKWPDKPASAGRTGEIIRTKHSIFLSTRKDVEGWFQQHPTEKENAKSMCWLGVPMLIRNKVIGVISVFSPNKENLFNAGDQDVLQTLANLAASALENASLYNEAREEVVAAKQLSTLGIAIASVQHTINNTLNLIGPNLDLLSKHLNLEDPEVKQSFNIIERNTRITTRLLQRIQSPLQEVTYADAIINSLLVEIVEEQKQYWAADNPHVLIDVTLELDERIPVLRLPLTQISDVLKNVIQNSYHALTSARRYKDLSTAKLQVSSSFEKGSVIVRVKDNVPGGISNAMREWLFERPTPPKIPGEGSGLGLWLNKLMMTSIGGDIRIESTGVSGTIMLVEFPIPD